MFFCAINDLSIKVENSQQFKCTFIRFETRVTSLNNSSNFRQGLKVSNVLIYIQSKKKKKKKSYFVVLNKTTKAESGKMKAM